MPFLCYPVVLEPWKNFFEVVTWSQLGLHNKPIVLLNWNGFYDSLVQMFHTMVGSGFLKKENMDLVIVLRETKDLLTQLQNYSPSKTEKWLSEDTI